MSTSGMAVDRIPFGAPVLCRGFRVSLAAEEVANGIAKSRPLYRGDEPIYEIGQFVCVEPVQGLGNRDLHAIANGPIMDASNLYLPAGKLTKAEADARQAADMQVHQ